MIGALLYLTRRSLWNRLAAAARRLRRVRYAVGLALGVAYIGGYLWLWFGRPLSEDHAASGYASTIAVVGSLVLLLSVGRAWLFGAPSPPLPFTAAEIQFLFPAPLSRRSLVLFKLLRWQSFILLNTVLWTILLRRGTVTVPVVPRTLALWAIFSTLMLHRVGASMVRSGLAEEGRDALRRRPLTIATLTGVVAAIAASLVRHGPALAAAREGGFSTFWQAFERYLASPIPAALLFPFHLMLAPLTAPSLGAWGLAMLPLLGLLALHYAWVLQADTAFEEAAVHAAERRLERSGRSRGRRAASATGLAALSWLRLAPRGAPGAALVWKNLIAALRPLATPGTLWWFAISLTALVIGIAAGLDFLLTILFVGGVAWGGVLLVTGPLNVRNDLRRDLSWLGMLRSYPLRGEAVVRAEVAASTITLTAAQAVLFGLAFVALLPETPANLTFADAVAGFFVLLLLLPSLNVVGLVVQNAAALLFPAWAGSELDRPQGLEGVGQQVLSTVASLLARAVLLAPGVVAAWGILILTGDRLGWWAGLPAALGLGAVVAAEMMLIFRWLGGVFDATDPSAIGPGGGG